MVTTQTQKHRRPLAITIVVWVLLVGAVVHIVLGAFAIFLDKTISDNITEITIFAEDDPDLLTDDGSLLVGGIYSILSGIVQLAIAIGFWWEKQWAWVAAVSWQALQLLVEIATPFDSEDKVVTMVFCIVLIFLLNQSDVRRAFSITRSADESSKPLHILDVN